MESNKDAGWMQDADKEGTRRIDMTALTCGRGRLCDCATGGNRRKENEMC